MPRYVEEAAVAGDDGRRTSGGDGDNGVGHGVEEENLNVFEIREYLDDHGNEVSNEVLSVRDAMREVQTADVLGAIKRAAAARETTSKEAASQSEMVTAAAGVNTGSQPSPKIGVQRMLDDHDWEGIKERAKELEKKQKAGQPDRRESQVLQGKGWMKGFLNRSSMNKERNTSANAICRGPPPSTSAEGSRFPLSVSSGSTGAANVVEKSAAADVQTQQRSSILKTEKRVRFCLPAENIVLQGEEGDRADSGEMVEKKTGSVTKPASAASAFTGTIAERSDRPQPPSLSVRAVGVVGGVGMSRFKARALGLPPPDGQDAASS